MNYRTQTERPVYSDICEGEHTYACEYGMNDDVRHAAELAAERAAEVARLRKRADCWRALAFYSSLTAFAAALFGAIMSPSPWARACPIIWAASSSLHYVAWRTGRRAP